MKRKKNPAMAGQDHEAGRVQGGVFHGECFTKGADSQALDPVAWKVRA